MSKYTLNNHMVTIHGEYQCHYCDYKQADGCLLKTHIISVHEGVDYIISFIFTLVKGQEMWSIYCQ